MILVAAFLNQRYQCDPFPLFPCRVQGWQTTNTKPPKTNKIISNLFQVCRISINTILVIYAHFFRDFTPFRFTGFLRIKRKPPSSFTYTPSLSTNTWQVWPGNPNDVSGIHDMLRRDPDTKKQANHPSIDPL